jgi:hypothetical protein
MHPEAGMKIFVGGSLQNVEAHADLCRSFVQRFGELIVEREHILLTGCRGSLDKAIAETVDQRLKGRGADVRKYVISYCLKNDLPAHKVGRILVSKRVDWLLNHPDLDPPEQIADADVTIFVAGGEGTFQAANWARIAGKPVLGIGLFRGAGQAIFERERERFEQRYSSMVSIEDFDTLNQVTDDMDQLARDTLALCEALVIPNTVFVVMSFHPEFDELFIAYSEVCKELGFKAVRTDKDLSLEKIVPRILKGIRHAAFVIADVTESSPNVFYEIGFAEGLGRPIIATARRGTPLPFDIADTPVTFWNSAQELKEKLLPLVAEVKRNLGRGYRSRG